MAEKKPITFLSRITELESRKDELNESNLKKLAQQYEKDLSFALDKFNSARTKAEKQIISSEINWIMQQQINVQSKLDEVLRLSEKIEELRSHQKKIKDDIEETDSKKILLKGDIKDDEVYIYTKEQWLTDIAKKMDDRTLKEDTVYDNDGKVKEYGYSELLGAARYWDIFNSMKTDETSEENTENLSIDDLIEQALYRSVADGIVSDKKPLNEQWFFKRPYTEKTLIENIYKKSRFSWTKKSELWFKSSLLAEKIYLPGWEDIRKPWEYDIKVLYNGKEYTIHLTINGLENIVEDSNQGKAEETAPVAAPAEETTPVAASAEETVPAAAPAEETAPAAAPAEETAPVEEASEETSEAEEHLSENVEKFDSQELYERCRLFFRSKIDENVNIEEFLKEEDSYEQFIASWKETERKMLPKNWDELMSALLPEEYIKNKDSAFIALVTSPIDLTETDGNQAESEILNLARKIFYRTQEIPMNSKEAIRIKEKIKQLWKKLSHLSKEKISLMDRRDMYHVSSASEWDEPFTRLDNERNECDAEIKKQKEELEKVSKKFNDKLLTIIIEKYPYLKRVIISYIWSYKIR